MTTSVRFVVMTKCSVAFVAYPVQRAEGVRTNMKRMRQNGNTQFLCARSIDLLTSAVEWKQNSCSASVNFWNSFQCARTRNSLGTFDIRDRPKPPLYVPDWYPPSSYCYSREISKSVTSLGLSTQMIFCAWMESTDWGAYVGSLRENTEKILQNDY